MVRRFHRGNFARSSCKWIGRELHADYLACQFEPELPQNRLDRWGKVEDYIEHVFSIAVRCQENGGRCVIPAEADQLNIGTSSAQQTHAVVQYRHPVRRANIFKIGLFMKNEVVFLALLSIIALPLGAATTEDVRTPNIVLILADDMGFSDIGSYGGEIDTPNIDRLAEEGVRFNQFYNTSRCSSTRASLLTGMYPHMVQMGHLAGKRFNEVDGFRGDLDQKVPTLAEILRRAGYTSYMAGKWHLANYDVGELTGKSSIADLANTPLKRGFTGFYGNMLGGTNYFNPRYLYSGNTLVETVDDGFYYTHAISESSVDFISGHLVDSPSRPFFLYVAYTAPHWPIQAPELTIQKYEQRYQQGWDEARRQRYEKQTDRDLIGKKTTLPPRAKGIEPWESVENKDWQARRMAVHAAMVEELDKGVGEIVNTLRARSQLDNTLIIFLSDNGASAEVIPSPKNDQQKKMLAKFLGKYTPSSGESMNFGNDPNLLPGGKTELQTLGDEWAQVSNSPFRLYKSWVHEGGIASPLIIRGPAVAGKTGRITQTVGHVIDIVPTVMDLLASYGLSFSTIGNFDGQSLLPALRGDAQRRDILFFEHEGNRAVRDGRWKLVAEHGKDWELYDMQEDRAETRNLAEMYPERVAQMTAQYREYAKTHKVLSWDQVNTNTTQH